MRLVLDTAVMIAAIRSDTGASRQLLVAGLEGDYTPLLSVPLILEYEAVMTRAEHLAAANLSEDDVGAMLDAFVQMAEPVRPAFLWRPTLADANDDMLLEVAVNGQADRLVTFNQRDFGSAAARFGLVVSSPADVVAALESRK